MTFAGTKKRPEQQVGRYAIFDTIASGGMATVHLARLVGSGGFSRVVAAKRMHRHFLQDPNLRHMFLAEARLAARIAHPNVVPILDVLSHDEELIIVMEYIHGESLLALLRATHQAKQVIPGPIGCAIVAALLEGLHAAHEAQNEKGEPLGIVHRDVSPQNVLVGADGVARVLDFGIAKALQDQPHTNPGILKGKYSYMAPEVIRGEAVTRQADVFSAGIVLWEVLAGKMLFGGTNEHDRMMRIVAGNYPSPRQHNPTVPPVMEKIVAKALGLEPSSRYTTALEFALAVEKAGPIATRRVIGEWVRRLVPETLDNRERMIQAIETSSIGSQTELPLSSSRLDDTPPPAFLHPQPGEFEPPLAGTAEPGHAESADYACIQVNRSGDTAHTTPRPLARVIAVAIVAFAAAIVLLAMLSGKSQKPMPNPAPTPATTAVPPDPVPPPSTMPILAGEANAPDHTPQPAENKNATVFKAPQARAPSGLRPPKRTTSHGKQYLPGNL